ncbi:MAG: sugar phosphate isomerase/epimerase [Chloroflexi bacterium]|nr:sugar phosphate isomerase/epimerase [Chloroflexota bacterium]
MSDGITYSLSTMWAQQDRFADMHDFVRVAQSLGYDAIEVSHATAEAPFDRLLDGSGARFSGIHAPAPNREALGKRNSSLNLAALEDEERQTAIAETKRSIGHAASVEAGFVIVHLGAIGSRMLDSELKQRRLFDAGTRTGPEVEALRRETLERRAEQAPPYFERARESLAELAADAKERGVALGLENRLHYHEFPLPDEALALIGGYPADLVGYWHDVGHAEVQARLGYVDKRAWLDTLGSRTLGCHLHDVDGIGDHRAPGNGDVEWDYIAEGLPASALRVFEINQRQLDTDVAGAIPFLRERGVVA